MFRKDQHSGNSRQPSSHSSLRRFCFHFNSFLLCLLSYYFLLLIVFSLVFFLICHPCLQCLQSLHFFQRMSYLPSLNIHLNVPFLFSQVLLIFFFLNYGKKVALDIENWSLGPQTVQWARSLLCMLPPPVQSPVLHMLSRVPPGIIPEYSWVLPPT